MKRRTGESRRDGGPVPNRLDTTPGAPPPASDLEARIRGLISTEEYCRRVEERLKRRRKENR